MTLHLDEMLTRYYDIRGWDEQGCPTEEKLRELGLA
jgi:aldehyde:ferredoxin oxidoreductase